MAGSRRVVIEFLGQDKSLGRTANDAGTKMDRLGARMRKVGKIAAVGLAAGAVVAGKALYEMGKAAAEDQQSAALLAKQLKSSAGATRQQIAATEDWITAQGKAFGVTDDELRPALAKLVRATGDVGKAQKLASLAMDVSAGTGKDLGAVSMALAKAQGGQVSSLARLGINVKDAEGKTISFTEAQKRMADQFGGAAATKAETLQGKIDRLKLQFSEAGEAIGYKLLPIALKFTNWVVSTAIPAVSKFTAELRAKLGPVIQWVRNLFGSSTNGMSSDVSKNLGAIRATFQSVVSIVQSLWAQFGTTIKGFTTATFNNLRTNIGGALQVISGIFKVFAALLKGDWSGVWEGIKQIVRGALSVLKGLVSQGLSIMRSLFRAAASAIRGTFSGLWSGLRSLASAGINKVVDAIRAVPGKIRALGSSFKSAGKHIITQMLDGIKNASGFVSDIAGSIWKAIKAALNAGINKINSALEFKIAIPGAPDVHVNPPNIPHLAKGGVVKARQGGTLALLGEAGADEAVIPLSGKHAPKGVGGSGTTIQFNISGALDPDAVATQIRQMLLKLKRTNGGELGLA